MEIRVTTSRCLRGRGFLRWGHPTHLRGARRLAPWPRGSVNADRWCTGRLALLTSWLSSEKLCEPDCARPMLPKGTEGDESSLHVIRGCKRIKILFIIDYFHRTGGTEKHLAELIGGLPASEFDCSVVAFDIGANPLLDGLRARGVPIISVPVAREYAPNAVIQGWRLSQLIRNNHYDIIQTMHQKADSYGALIAWLSGCRHLVSSKRDTGELRKPWHFFVNRRLRGLFDGYIVVADAVRAAVIANENLPPERIVTIYNGVDAERFSVPAAEEKAEARARLGFCYWGLRGWHGGRLSAGKESPDVLRRSDAGAAADTVAEGARRGWWA